MHSIPRILAVSATLLFALAVLVARGAAQSARMKHTVTTAVKQPAMLGREFWFAMPSNYGPAIGGKYIALHLCSPGSGLVHIQLMGGPSAAITLTPNKTTVFNIPLAWEIETSGIIELK